MANATTNTAEKSAPRTPGPWAQSDLLPYLIFKDSFGVVDFKNPVARCQQTKQGRANARFIITACNSHDALVAALKGIRLGQVITPKKYAALQAALSAAEA